ncbi:hypothetical protein [Streptomyces sp. B6B3]|uniref:hypothetical protein n=1 Tax=Streptomyces sp. B6B3 TaxID=3153570 RepID=UPI00325DBAD9
MAFGIERVQQTVNDIQTALSAVNREMHSGFDRVLTAISEARNDVNVRLDAVQADIRSLRDTATQTSADGRAIRNDITQLHALIEGWRAEAAAVRAEAEVTRRALEATLVPPAVAEAASVTGPPAEPPPRRPTARVDGADYGDTGDEDPGYVQLLEFAAGVACAELVCHRDTWAFLVEQAARVEHFRLTVDVHENDDGTINAEVSGRTLIAVIDALWNTHRDPANAPGTRALAIQTYRRVHDALQGLEPPENGAQAPTRIVINDRPPTPADEEAQDD